MTPTTPLVDLRTIPPRDRHPLLFATFGALAEGEAMKLLNDHDPLPLYDRFQAEQPGCFSWDYLQCGPQLWQVRITRQARVGAALSRAPGSCCGGCCGA